MFLNPPYGIRLDQEEGVADVYRLIASVAKSRFPGWKLAVMTGYVHALNEMKLTPQKQYGCLMAQSPASFIYLIFKA